MLKTIKLVSLFIISLFIFSSCKEDVYVTKNFEKKYIFKTVESPADVFGGYILYTEKMSKDALNAEIQKATTDIPVKLTIDNVEKITFTEIKAKVDSTLKTVDPKEMTAHADSLLKTAKLFHDCVVAVVTMTDFGRLYPIANVSAPIQSPEFSFSIVDDNAYLAALKSGTQHGIYVNNPVAVPVGTKVTVTLKYSVKIRYTVTFNPFNR